MLHEDRIYMIYHRYLMLHIQITNMLLSYQANPLPTLRMLLTEDMSAKDAKLCLTQVVGTAIKNADLIFVANAIYNTKLDFVASLTSETNIEEKYLTYVNEDMQSDSYDEISINSLERPKRWFFSSPLATITGLADQEEFNVLSKATKEAIAHEELDAKEIQHLDSKTNEILAAIKNQNSKVLKLSTEEHKLHEQLEKMLIDESSLIKQLGLISKSMEMLSDISISYASLFHGISLIPYMVEQLEVKILSALSQTVAPDMLPENFPPNGIENYGLATLKGTTVSAEISSKGFLLSYRIPDILDQYRVFNIKTIPFLLQNHTFAQINVENTQIAVNSRG
jgi:hypothetical protein